MKIVVVGGGTAGWIASYFINKTFPNRHDLTIIESSKIGIIGAGEGSTGLLIDLLNGHFFNYKVDVDDFLKYTDGTKKFGIEHINWSKNKKTYFAPLDASPTAFNLNDYIFKYILYKNNNIDTHMSSRLGVEYTNKNFNNTYACHFDGHKVGSFFKNICTLDHKNTVIDSEVEDVFLNEKGYVEYLLLKNNKKIYGDLFIDCTGFSKKISSAVGTKWVSYSDILPLNTAMPFIVPNNNNKVDLVTKAHALSSGWMWEIPLQTRTGMGYVFDKNFISVDQAKLEVEKYLGKEVEPIKIINFDSGHVDKFWNKNVINFGLSSSFVEPLEATSIHNTIVQISTFVSEFLSENKLNLLNEKNQKKYNEKITKLNKLTIDFISIHYQGKKDNSKFWEYIKKEKIISEGAQEYLDLCKHKIPMFTDLDGIYGSYSIPLANWIGSGLNLLNPKIAEESLKSMSLINYADYEYKNFYNSIVHSKKYISYS
jgi:tryptophan halogenase